MRQCLQLETGVRAARKLDARQYERPRPAGLASSVAMTMQIPSAPAEQFRTCKLYHDQNCGYAVFLLTAKLPRSSPKRMAIQVAEN